MALVAVNEAQAYLDKRHIRYELAVHTGTYTAGSEARALGIPAAYVLKAVMLKVDGRFMLALAPASRRLDLYKLATFAKSSNVSLASEYEIRLAFPQFELGALPPLPELMGVTAVADPLIFEPDEMAFADGCRTESLIASPRELLWGQPVHVAPITRDPENWGLWASV